MDNNQLSAANPVLAMQGTTPANAPPTPNIPTPTPPPQVPQAAQEDQQSAPQPAPVSTTAQHQAPSSPFDSLPDATPEDIKAAGLNVPQGKQSPFDSLPDATPEDIKASLGYDFRNPAASSLSVRNAVADQNINATPEGRVLGAVGEGAKDAFSEPASNPIDLVQQGLGALVQGGANGFSQALKEMGVSETTANQLYRDLNIGAQSEGVRATGEMAMRNAAEPAPQLKSEITPNKTPSAVDFDQSKMDQLVQTRANMNKLAPQNTPLETDVSKIDPATPLSAYKDAQAAPEEPVNSDFDAQKVNDLYNTNKQIEQLTKIGDQSAQGKAQLAQLQSKADALLDDLLQPTEQAGTEPASHIMSMLQNKAAGLRDDLSGGPKAVAEEPQTAVPETEQMADLGAETPKTTKQSADDLRQLGSDSFEKGKASTSALTPEFTNSLLDKLKSQVRTSAVGKLVSKNNPASTFIQELEGHRDKPMTVADLMDLDAELNDRIDDHVENGKLKAKGQKLYNIQTIVRNAVEDAPEDQVVGGKDGFDDFNQARHDWGQSYKLSEVERILRRADGMDNEATAIKTGFRNLVNNPNRMRGWSPDEIEAATRASKSGLVVDALRVAGNRMIPAMAGIAESVGGGGLTGGIASGLASHALGTSARTVAGQLQAVRANAVGDVIRNNAGPAGLMKKAAEKAAKKAD